MASPKFMDKEQLDAKIAELNTELEPYPKHKVVDVSHSLKIHARDYYINKLNALDESGLDTIEV